MSSLIHRFCSQVLNASTTTFGEVPSPEASVSMGVMYFWNKVGAKWQGATSTRKTRSEMWAKLAQTDRRESQFSSGESQYLTAVRLHIRICCSHHTVLQPELWILIMSMATVSRSKVPYIWFNTTIRKLQFLGIICYICKGTYGSTGTLKNKVNSGLMLFGIGLLRWSASHWAFIFKIMTN